MNKTKRYYIALFSIHGLIRGKNIELGRDADTGGQIKYVVELARELGKQEQVARVDLFTRQVIDPKVSQDYAQQKEQLSENAYIIRLPCGPKRYLRKEVLWNYLESFLDHTLQHFRQLAQVPDVIHSHYADAGYVGSVLANVLEVPFIFTGHSLGLVKKTRLLEKGVSEETIKGKYNIHHRIEAEEKALNIASMVVTSTHQEIHEQYEQYQHYEPDRMFVIPPGVDLEHFYPVSDYNREIEKELSRFLTEPNKPIILALSRADERKNIPALIQAYGENAELQKRANLVIVAGNRDDITTMDKGTRQVLTQILLGIDRYDLYGRVAYPKHHQPSDVPEFYRFAVASKGIFVNPALTEPFGLTLIEAAASGLPIVATHDGGPIDIIKNCQNGLLIDPLDTKAMGDTLVSALSDKARWETWSKKGIEGVKRHYSWTSHAKTYLNHIEKAIAEIPLNPIYQKRVSSQQRRTHFGIVKLPLTQRFIISDIDQTLIGDPEALSEFLGYLNEAGNTFSFGIATSRTLDEVIELLEEWDVPFPDVLITLLGTEIYYGPNLLKDTGWEKHINYRWEPERLKEVLSSFKGIEMQEQANQSEFKISYLLDTERVKKKLIRRDQIVKRLRQNRLLANVILTYGQFLDLLPIRASKGLAVRYLAYRWGLPLEQFLVAGDSGNDEDMLKGEALGVVVGNYSAELEKLRGKPRIYFAKGHYARGILEGIAHFGFLNDTLTPHDEEN
ncbi:MAG: HAD-IIB family hydrolase [Pseudomonadota bacterium]